MTQRVRLTHQLKRRREPRKWWATAGCLLMIVIQMVFLGSKLFQLPPKPFRCFSIPSDSPFPARIWPPLSALLHPCVSSNFSVSCFSLFFVSCSICPFPVCSSFVVWRWLLSFLWTPKSVCSFFRAILWMWRTQWIPSCSSQSSVTMCRVSKNIVQLFGWEFSRRNCFSVLWKHFWETLESQRIKRTGSTASFKDLPFLILLNSPNHKGN